MDSGERIKILRILNGFTQQTLADIAEVSRSSVMLWEKGKLPTRRTATALSYLFEVSQEYLLEGVNPPSASIWKPIPPGHPKHMPAMAVDLKTGINSLFRELGISYVANGQEPTEKKFMLCGKDPSSSEWLMNYLLIYDNSLNSVISDAVRCSGANISNLGDVHYCGGLGDFVTAVIEELFDVYNHYPDCNQLLNRLGGVESGGHEDFTLAGLLKQFGKVIVSQERGIYEDDIETMADFIAEEILKTTGFKNIKNSSIKLLRAALVHTKGS